MSMRDEDIVCNVETDAKAELGLVEASRVEQAREEPVEQWMFDPTDAEREQVRLRSLLGAVEAVTSEGSLEASAES